ncbi:MAG: 50S ribosomal protein L25 [Patescibacteria group bacterium]|nr:50S ribosomal protein L25 [Patescibacteria group bacterium]
MQTLKATKRSKADKLVSIRSNGMIPAVVYGALIKNTPIYVPGVSFEKIFKEAGESSTIILELEDTEGKEKVTKTNVLIHEVQVDPVKGFPIHIDFLAIDMDKPVEVTVPIEFTGVAPAEKNGLGVLVKVLHEIEIEALPKDLPHSISADVTSLIALGDQIHVKDIQPVKGVKILTDGLEVVALISAVKEEVEEAPADISAIEVEKKGKKDTEADEVSGSTNSESK